MRIKLGKGSAQKGIYHWLQMLSKESKLYKTYSNSCKGFLILQEWNLSAGYLIALMSQSLGCHCTLLLWRCASQINVLAMFASSFE